MKRAVEVRGNVGNIVDNNGLIECSFNPSVWISMGETSVADDDMEISCDGKIFNVNKGDIFFVFRRGRYDTEIVSFKNDVISNYIKTQIEKRNKDDVESNRYIGSNKELIVHDIKTD